MVSVDTDEDGTPNYLDGHFDRVGGDDSDGDGIPDAVEGTVDDTDGDGILNYLDVDSDGDGIDDAVERTATSFHVHVHAAWPNGNFVPLRPADTDWDGTPNYLDSDSDGDGIPDSDEGTADDDGDSIPNYLDGPDGDGDGIFDVAEGSDVSACARDIIVVRVHLIISCYDADRDGTPNSEDLDSDGDGIDDADEGIRDTDGDGIADYLDVDSDGDRILDADEGVADADGDGTPNYLDVDSDGDGLPDFFESPNLEDTDGDGVPNYLDLDSDNDGVVDASEVLDFDDNDGRYPDYLHATSNHHHPCETEPAPWPCAIASRGGHGWMNDTHVHPLREWAGGSAQLDSLRAADSGVSHCYTNATVVMAACQQLDPDADIDNSVLRRRHVDSGVGDLYSCSPVTLGCSGITYYHHVYLHRGSGHYTLSPFHGVDLSPAFSHMNNIYTSLYQRRPTHHHDSEESTVSRDGCAWREPAGGTRRPVATRYRAFRWLTTPDHQGRCQRVHSSLRPRHSLGRPIPELLLCTVRHYRRVRTAVWSVPV